VFDCQIRRQANTGSLITLEAIMPVRPAVPCVAPKLITDGDFINWQAGYVAWYGYANTDGPAVEIPVGSANAFDPLPADRGQPTSFTVGTRNNVFAVFFPAAGAVTWTLNGMRQSASAASTRCGSIAAVTIDGGVPICIDAARPPTGDPVLAAADVLADYLHRMTGHDFPVRRTPRPDGISLGVDGDFARYFRWPYTARVFEPDFRFGKQDYIIATQGGRPPRISIAGASVEALRSAVWEFLFQLGYRQYFPGPTWEVIPIRPVIADLRLDIYRRPAYLTRFMNLKPALAKSDEIVGEKLVERQSDQTIAWFARNQSVDRPAGRPEQVGAAGGWRGADNGHARILTSWIESLPRAPGDPPRTLMDVPCELGNWVMPDPDADPTRRSAPPDKLCLPYAAEVPGIGRVTAVDVALAWAARPENAARDFLNMNVADGGTWICKQACRADSPEDMSYTHSDRAVALANAVARARQPASANDDGIVGLRAYATWTAAPTRPDVTVERNVLVEIADSYPEDLDRLARDWRDKGARLFGVRDNWSDIDKPLGNAMDGPAHACGGLPHMDWMRERIGRFHASGVRFYFASEEDDLRANVGLGYWLAARALLTSEAGDAAWASNDFAERAFGDAAPYVRDYLAAMDSAMLPASVAIGRMYRALNAALPLVRADPVRRERLRALVVYPRYRELVRACETYPPCAPGSPPARAVAGFVYATRGLRMLSTKDIFERHLPETERAAVKAHPLPELSAPPRDLDGWDAWQAELGAYLESLIAGGAASPRNRELFADSELRLAYHAADTLVPARLPPFPEGSGLISEHRDQPILHIGAGYWYTWAEGSAPIRCSVAPETADSGAMVRLWVLAPGGWEAVDRRAVHGAGATSIAFATPHAGRLYRIDVFPTPGASNCHFTPGEGQRCVTVAGFGRDRTTNTLQRPWMFYVPRGTRVVGGAVKRGGIVMKLHAWQRGADGAWVGPRVLTIPRDTDHFRFEVLDPDAGGQVWVFNDIQWNQRNPVLLTVPPQVARWTDEFLLPASVVAADGLAP
jgi:hypothetical protein